MREPDLDAVNRALSVTVQKLTADLKMADADNTRLTAEVGGWAELNEKLLANERAIINAIPAHYLLDPPDGGSVTIAEGITRLTAARAECERQYQEKVQEIIALTAEVERLGRNIAWLGGDKLLTERDAFTARVAHLEEAISRIGRMRVEPDDVINRMTLLAAIEIAAAALPQPTPMEKTV
jgi:hypothetical protein